MNKQTITFLRLARWLVARLPRQLGLQICNLIGDLCFLFVGSARRLAKANVRRVLAYDLAGGSPHTVDPTEVGRIVRQTFRNQVANYYDLLWMGSRSLAEIHDLVDVIDLHHLAEGVAGGRGILMVTCHVGVPDYGVRATLGRGWKTMSPVEIMQDKAAYDFFTEVRAAHGLELVPAEASGLRRLLKGLRENAILGIAADRDIHGNGVPVSFFGAPTTMAGGTAALAIRTKAPIIHCISFRNPTGRYTAIINPPMPIADLLTGNFEADVAAITQRIAHLIEVSIRNHIEQWAAFNRVWRDSLP